MNLRTVILSRDRPAQLDLLLTSLERNGAGLFNAPAVIFKASSMDYGAGYIRCFERHRRAFAVREGNFEAQVKAFLHGTEYLVFFCDDDVMYRPVLPDPFSDLEDESVLTFSLRLGWTNTTIQYPSGIVQEIPPDVPWRWREATGDFGYPGSLDGHIFRTADLRRLLGPLTFGNPTSLEAQFADRCIVEIATDRPMMTCYAHSVVVGVPINRVSEQSGVRFGVEHPASAAELNRRYLLGDRLDLDAIDFSAVVGAHTELRLPWARRLASV